MTLGSIAVEEALLILKILFLVLLYLFIWRIVRSATREVRLPQESFVLGPDAVASLRGEAPRTASGRLVVEKSPALNAISGTVSGYSCASSSHRRARWTAVFSRCWGRSVIFESANSTIHWLTASAPSRMSGTSPRANRNPSCGDLLSMAALGTYLAMGGYAGFVWPAYATAFFVLGGLTLHSWRRHRQSQAALEQLRGAQPMREP